jgi:hypothetical protein
MSDRFVKECLGAMACDSACEVLGTDVGPPGEYRSRAMAGKRICFAMLMNRLGSRALLRTKRLFRTDSSYQCSRDVAIASHAPAYLDRSFYWLEMRRFARIVEP